MQYDMCEINVQGRGLCFEKKIISWENKKLLLLLVYTVH